MWQDISAIDKELQINKTIRHKPIEKVGENLNIHFTKEDTQVNRCVQLYKLSRKCKPLEAGLSLHGLYT